RWFQAIGQALRDKYNHPIRMVGTLVDITERRNVEKMKNEFVSVVSHELRTPITSIRGALGLVLSGKVGEFSDKTKSLLDIANNNCERLLLLINDILDMEKIEAGKMVFRLKKVDIKEVVSEAITANKMYGDKFDVEMKLISSDDTAQVYVDPDRVMQVLGNLISNAIKFSPKGAVVSVDIHCYGSMVRVSVADKGSGIDKDFQSKIFQKFSQADSSDARGKGGTGLGLSISKALIEKLGGTLSFISDEKEGTTFYFDLPICDNSLIPEKEEKNALRGAKWKLLICEDDEDQANYLSALLTSAGFNVDIADKVSDAKRLIDQNHYHALLLDLILPDQDGIAFIRELRNWDKAKTIPIVVISIIAETGRALLNGEAFAVVDWLDKPIDFNKLLQTISSIKSRHPAKVPNILHVEDDVETQKVIAALLSKEAHVVSVSTMQEALNKIDTTHFDLVILDLLLPDGNGVDLIPLFADHNLPIIIYSVLELDKKYAHHVREVLIKSKTSHDKLLNTIESVIEE
ncbi:MAG: response regulator, partial [Gammaproteobacteria bacterium]